MTKQKLKKEISFPDLRMVSDQCVPPMISDQSPAHMLIMCHAVPQQHFKYFRFLFHIHQMTHSPHRLLCPPHGLFIQGFGTANLPGMKRERGPGGVKTRVLPARHPNVHGTEQSVGKRLVWVRNGAGEGRGNGPSWLLRVPGFGWCDEPLSHASGGP